MEIEYLEKKLGLSSGDSKSKKEVRRRLNKELKEDGFGDDIFDFLDQMDHVMDAPDMEKIKKELSSTEIEALEKKVKGKSQKKKGEKRVDVTKLESEVGELPLGLSDDDGLDENLSDEVVDSNYLRSFARDNGLQVLNSDGEEEMEGEIDDEELLASEDDASLNESDVPSSDVPSSDVPSSDVPSNDVPSNETNQEDADLLSSDHSEEKNDSTKPENQPDSESKEIRYQDITDIYGRVKAGHEDDLKKFTSKYVPPHLRNQSSNSDESSQVDQAITKQIREIVNKVTDDTFVSMCQLLVATYAKYPKNSVRNSLYDTIIAATRNDFKVIHHYIRLYAGLIAAAQHESDMNVVSYFTENVVNLFERECTKAIDEHNTNV